MEIKYNIIFSNRKTIGINIERDKSIIVRAPNNISKEEIQNFIDRKRFWIYTKINHPQKYKKEIKTEFISGASILYLGRYYKLDIKNEDVDKIKFKNKFIISKKNQKIAKDLFKKWYVNKAKEKIIPKVGHFAKNMALPSYSVN